MTEKRSIPKSASSYINALKKQGSLIVPCAFFFVWILAAFLTNTYFQQSSLVVESNILEVVLFGVLLLASIAAILMHMPFTSLRFRRAVFLLATVFAVGSLLVSIVVPQAIAPFAIEGCLIGLSIAAFTLVLVIELSGMEQKLKLTVVSGALLLAFLLFFLMVWLVNTEMIRYALMLLLGASLVLYYRFTTRTPQITALPVAGSSLIKPEGKATKIELSILLFASGFLPAYLLTMFPRTTHYAGILYSSFLGGVSDIAFFALLFSVVIFAAITLGLWGKKPSLPLYSLIVLILFAGVCMTVPSMSIDNSLPFMLVAPIAVAALSLSLCLFDNASSNSPSKTNWEKFGGYVLASSGALCAALFALYFIGTIDREAVVVIQHFYPAIVMVALVILVIFLFILLRKNLMLAFFPDYEFKEPLDTSDLTNRCKVFADTYGLTPREEELLVFFSEGRDMPYIEKALTISRSTVKTHTTHIYQKVGVASRQELLDLLRDRQA